MAQAYVDAKKLKLSNVRRKLFCTEKPRSPTHIIVDHTPITYSRIPLDSATVFFFGYSSKRVAEGPVEYFCADCFISHFRLDDTDECFDSKYAVTGERLLSGFTPSRTDFCVDCNKRLFIIRKYDSAHLDFS